MRIIAGCCATMMALAVTAAPAEANVLYSFSNITNNNSTDAAIGESQFSMTVLDAGNGFVEFRFDNSGPAASSLTDVYFDDSVDPSLFVTPIHAIDDTDSGVAFSEGAAPGDLPGGNDLDPVFNATKGLTADSDPAVAPNGVNPGESLGVTLQLDNGHSFGDVISALSDESLRVGIHVQAFEGGGSESFVNNPGGGPPAVPEPSSLALVGLGLAGLAGRRIRRKREQKEDVE